MCQVVNRCHRLSRLSQSRSPFISTVKPFVTDNLTKSI
nr:MAG TPA: hypothetical protein [Caudoviricetes sp.]